VPAEAAGKAPGSTPRHTRQHQARLGTEAEATVIRRLAQQYTALCALLTQCFKCGAHQRRTDALPLPRGQHRDRAQAKPARAAIADRHRRQGNGRPPGPELGHQRNAQFPARTQRVDDELLGVAAVRGFAEGSLGECMDGGVVSVVSARIV
jgi:hypothetical protein